MTRRTEIFRTFYKSWSKRHNVMKNRIKDSENYTIYGRIDQNNSGPEHSCRSYSDPLFRPQFGQTLYLAFLFSAKHYIRPIYFSVIFLQLILYSAYRYRMK